MRRCHRSVSNRAITILFLLCLIIYTWRLHIGESSFHAIKRSDTTTILPLPLPSGSPVSKPEPMTDVPMRDAWAGNVVVVWCPSHAPFTFENYVSVRSVLRYGLSTTVTFVYSDKYPVADDGYNTWLQEIQESYPFWTNKPLPFSMCGDDRPPTKADLRRLLGKLWSSNPSGLIIMPRTLFTRPFSIEYSKYEIDGYDEETGQGFYFLPSRTLNQHTVKMSCPVVTYKDAVPETPCVILNGTVFPENIMYTNSSTSDHIRQVFYGSKTPPFPTQHRGQLAPRVAHYVWLGGGKMQLGFYLSVLSALYVARLDQVCIHGDSPPRGSYWRRLQSAVGGSGRLRYVPHDKPTLVFKQAIVTVAHLADVIKSYIMYWHGGVMMDPDVVFVRPPDPHLFYYDVVISPDIARRPAFPELFNMGVSISQPRSRFAQLWLDSQRNFRDQEWLWNCGQVTYKLWERRPQVALVCRNLQLMCYKFKLYTMWGHTNDTKDQQRFLKNWRTEAVTVHMTWPDPFSTFEDLVHVKTGMIGELGRMVLRAAGEIEEKQGLVP